MAGTERVPTSRLRRQILGGRGVRPEKRTKKLKPISHAPDTWPKTTKMKELEYKYNIKIEVILFDGSLDDVVKFLNEDVDRSTISKWWKRYEEYMEING